MTERLRDQREATDPVVSDGIDLLRAAAPLRVSDLQKRRVRRIIEQRRRQPGWRSALRPALAIGGIAVAAAAFLYATRVSRRRSAPISPVTEPGRASPAAPHVSPAPPALAPTQRAEPTPPPAATAVPSAVALAPRPAPRPAPAVRPAPAPAAPAAATAAAPPEEDESVSLAAAAQALRRDHDPARAERLLDGYLRRHPDGLFVEEALAMEIEAANAAGDRRAADFARDYLARFPTGQFAGAARAALRRN